VLRYAEPEWFASWLVQFGADIVVLDPPEVRDPLVQQLREIAARYRRPVPPSQPSRAPGGTAEPAGVG
jgi:proteasome accessory factor B